MICTRMTLTSSQILLLVPTKMSLSTLKSLISSETTKLVKSLRNTKKRRKRKSRKRLTTIWIQVTWASARIATKSMSTLIRSASSASLKLIRASMVRLTWALTRILLLISQMRKVIMKAKKKSPWVTRAMKQTRLMEITTALTSMIKSTNITRPSLLCIVIMTMMNGKSLSKKRDYIQNQKTNPNT